MDKIIWLDGHVTTISNEEAFRRQYEVYTDDGSEWRMKIGDAEFVWHSNNVYLYTSRIISSIISSTSI
jgi:hypothetical protein